MAAKDSNAWRLPARERAGGRQDAGTGGDVRRAAWSGPVTFLRVAEVSRRLGIAVPTLYRWVQRGLFPRPIRVGARASFWPEHELAGYQRAVMAGAGVDELRSLSRSLEGMRAGEESVRLLFPSA